MFKRQNIIILGCIVLGFIILIIALTGHDKTTEKEVSYLQGGARRTDEQSERKFEGKDGAQAVGNDGKPCCRRDENDLRKFSPLLQFCFTDFLL